VADAGAAVDAAKSALNQAKRDVKNGTLQANAIGDYQANLAAATTQLGQATLSAAASGAAAAATTGTGGFYATGSAEKTITEKTSTETAHRYIGSTFNVGGDASFDADSENGSIDIIGSNMDIAGGLALNAKDVTIKAGTEETTSTSSETTRTAGMTASYGSGGSEACSGGVNASGSNTDSDSYSKTHINSTINAGSLSSTSENLILSGANVEVAGGIDIDTGNLVIESLQDESSSSSKTEGYSIGGGCAVAAVGVALTGLSAAETAEGFDKVTSDYEYESGQRVKDSFSTETHQGEHEPLKEVGIDVAVAGATSLGAKIGLPIVADKVGDLYDVVKGKLGDDVALDTSPAAITDPSRLLGNPAKNNRTGEVDLEFKSPELDNTGVFQGSCRV
jgi:hypothetical protein